MTAEELQWEELEALKVKLAGWSDQELIDFGTYEPDSNKAWEAIYELQKRGTPEIFEAAVELLLRPDPDERETGVQILSQNVVSPKNFHEKALPILIDLLEVEQNEDVLCSIGIALGHISDKRAVEPLVAFKNHPSSDVRYGVVMGLSKCHTELAVQTLLELMEDEDDEVRDWATFSIGTLQDEADTPQIREALAKRLTDPYWEVEAEAITGLATRKDERALAPLLKYLDRDDPGNFQLEGAKLLGDPRLLPSLLRIKQLPQWQDESYEGQLLDEAIASCQGENAEK